MAFGTLFMANHLTLTWVPPEASLADKMVAKRLVITAVGKSTYNVSNRGRVSGDFVTRDVVSQIYADEEKSDALRLNLTRSKFLPY